MFDNDALMIRTVFISHRLVLKLINERSVILIELKRGDRLYRLAYHRVLCKDYGTEVVCYC